VRHFTTRELQFWELRARAYTIKDIARELSITPNTVEAIQFGLANKLGLTRSMNYASQLTRRWILREQRDLK